MAATSYGDERPLFDRHFAYRTWQGDHLDLGDHLLHGTAAALRRLAQEGHKDLNALLPTLAADEHDGAQWLLYEALIASGEERGAWAAELLLEGEHRLRSGYTCDSYWTTRQLLVAISPTIRDEQFSALEKSIMALRPEWETPPGGYTEFTLLSGLAENRLSEAGRRRLGELRRRFNQEQPEQPLGVHAGFIGPPIPQAAAQHMTDEQWLGAIAKHDSDEHDWRTLTGGAQQQGQVLEAETKTDPARFARLGLQLDASSHPAYINAILQGLGNTDNEVDPALVFDLMRHAAALGRADHDQWLGWALRRQLAEEVPDDIIQLVLDRALHAPDPADDAWLRDARDGQKFYGGNPFSNGMNTARGDSALRLGDLLVHDADGHRTTLVVDSFEELSSDPSVAVRTCVAHVLAAGLRHARPQAVQAFGALIETDDRLLASDPVEQLIVYIGFGDAVAVEPVIERMLGSEFDEVREAGGRLAAFAGLELDLPELVADVISSKDPRVRKGAAVICAHRLPFAGDGEAAQRGLLELIRDEDPAVRSAAAEVAGALRDRPLSHQHDLLMALVDSPAFTDALPQLLITLEHSSERVDELVLAAARRFVDLHQGQMDNIATSAAGDAKEIGELVLRAYAQADDAKGRQAALDLIDDLLAQAAYGFSEIVGAAER
jgi:hypothetical protein